MKFMQESSLSHSSLFFNARNAFPTPQNGSLSLLLSWPAGLLTHWFNGRLSWTNHPGACSLCHKVSVSVPFAVSLVLPDILKSIKVPNDKKSGPQCVKKFFECLKSHKLERRVDRNDGYLHYSCFASDGSPIRL